MSIHIPRNAVAVQFFLSPNCCLFMALLFGMFSAMVEIYDMHIWRTCKFHKKGARSDMGEDYLDPGAICKVLLLFVQGKQM